MRAPRSPRSPRTFRLDTAAILCAVLIAATACGSPASPGPASAAATIPASSGPSSGSVAPSAGGSNGLPISDADRAALADPTSVRVAEHEARVEAAIAERSGLLAILGPEGVAWLAQDRSNALQKALDAHEVKLTDRGPARLTSAALATPEDPASPDAIDGVPIFGATFTATAMVSLGVDIGIGTTSNPGQPSNNTSTSQQTVGGNRITTTTVTTTSLSWSGSTVIADVTLNQTVTTTDAATGAALGTTTNRVHVHAEANGCPDAAGIALVTLDVEFTGDASGMSGGSVTEIRSHSETRGQVNDAAVLDSISDQVDMSYTSTGANGSRQTATAITGLALPAGVAQQIDDGDVPPAEAANARALIVMLTAMTAGTILVFAEKEWQDGACVRIDATTARVRQVAPNQVVTFTAKPVHIIEGTDLDKPIRATFTGEASVAPVDTEERPPVSYTYTASSKKDKTGAVLLKSTSNRGIGILNIVFRTVVKGWYVDHAAVGSRVKGQHCGTEAGRWIMNGTYERVGQKGKQKWTIQIDGSTLTGTYSYTDDAVQNIAGVTVLIDGKARGNVTLTIADDGRALMHFKETSHSFVATVPGTPGKGRDQNAPLQESDQAWEVDETCP
jgi:hypothetical protein